MKIIAEREYQTYAGWRKAAKEAGATRFEGDRDIAQAFNGDTYVGEWDGAVGVIFVHGGSRQNPAASTTNLEQFGTAVISIMADNPEWGPDVGESLQAAADDLGLAGADRNGYFRRTAAAKRPGTTPLSKFGARVLKVMEDSPEWDSDVIDAIAEDAMNSGLADMDDDGMFQPTQKGSRRNPASKIRVGDEVIGIMGVDGGYAGTVTDITRDSRGRVLVTYRDAESGKERTTFDFNLSKNVPARGTFPRRNPLRRRPGESEREFMARCMSAEKKKFPRQDQRVAVCLSKARRNPFGSVGDV